MNPNDPNDPTQGDCCTTFGTNSNVMPQRASDFRQVSAFVWIAIAWIVGTLVFELTANGAEPPQHSVTSKTESMFDQWQSLETDFAITHAGIDQFDRIQLDSGLRPMFEAVIAKASAEATARIAQVAAPEPKQPDPMMRMEQSIPELMRVVFDSFQGLMSPVHVDPIGTVDSSGVLPIGVSKLNDASIVEVESPQARIIRLPPPLLRVLEDSVANVAQDNAADQMVPQSRILQPEDTTLMGPPLATVAITGPETRIAAQWPFTQSQPASEVSLVSLNVDRTDVRTVLEMLARGYRMNILVAPEVEGNVTANVEGLTADQTLQGIIKMCNLNMQKDGDLIYVYPASKLPSDARQLKVFPLDFARSEMIEPTVVGLLSPVGSAYTSKIDAKDNMRSQESIVVVDIPSAVAQVESFILQADQAPRQVLIEAKILEVGLTDDMVHGVNFESLIRGDVNIGAYGLADSIASQANPLFFAQIDGGRVSALIDLVETTTDSKTLASPRVQVVNGQNARIQVGQQLGFTVATVTQTSTIQDVQFLDTGVVLSVTPVISRDNRILMKVKPEVSDGEINPDTLLPQEETREVETSVLLENHQGMIIGGLIQEKDRTVVRKLPWLGDVRYIGKLFQRREAVRSRSEIIVALTCHILEPCVVDERSMMDLDRTETPLMHGLLQRNCRPWEPSMPDRAGEEVHLDVNRVNRMIP